MTMNFKKFSIYFTCHVFLQLALSKIKIAKPAEVRITGGVRDAASESVYWALSPAHLQQRNEAMKQSIDNTGRRCNSLLTT